jgi:hypothetical protein
MQNIELRDLYPTLSDEELMRAEENLKRYVESTLGLYERITSDPDAYARFQALTASIRNPYDDVDSKVESS